MQETRVRQRIAGWESNQIKGVLREKDEKGGSKIRGAISLLRVVRPTEVVFAKKSPTEDKRRLLEVHASSLKKSPAVRGQES